MTWVRVETFGGVVKNSVVDVIDQHHELVVCGGEVRTIL